MTTIAWDGKTIAADKAFTNGNARGITTKMRRLPNGDILAWTGDQDSALMVVQWYEQGADPVKWPECQKDKEGWARLIVAHKGRIYYYGRQPVWTEVEGEFEAWGAGADFAKAALHCGKSAKEAVEIASLYDVGTGCGVTVEIIQKPIRKSLPKFELLTEENALAWGGGL